MHLLQPVKSQNSSQAVNLFKYIFGANLIIKGFGLIWRIKNLLVPEIRTLDLAIMTVKDG